MTAARTSKGEKRKRFEWKVIKIPLSVLQITILIIFLAAGMFLFLRYNEHLPIRLPGVVEDVLSKLGIPLGDGGTGGSGGEEDLFEKRYATLSFLSGEVKVQRDGEMNWISAQRKLKLATGDRVRTFGGSRAEVLFDDGSILKIKADSLIVIGDLMENVKTKVRQSSVKLMVSSIEADIKKSVVEGSRFRLEMPSAVADMGRAQIRVDVGPGKDSKIKVFSGNVNVNTGRQRVSVGDLSQVSIGAGREVSAISELLSVPKIKVPKSLSKFLFNDQSRVSFFIRWGAVNKAAGYHVQIDRDRRFANPAVDKKGVKSTEYHITGLKPAVYYARVSASDLLGQEGLYSEPVVFMVVLDKVAPDVNIGKFVSSKAAGGYDIYVEGTTEPMVKIKLAGRDMVVDEKGRFSASLRSIPLNKKDVLLVGRDHAGNETIVPLKVTGG